MHRKIKLSALISLFSLQIIAAQFIVKDEIFAPNSVSNQGKVAGYQMQAGPYILWLPDSANTMTNIGGIAPGNGAGGQARFATDGNILCGTSMGIDGPEMSRYNRTTNQWTPVGSLGFSVDNTVSGGFGISGDGNTVVGNAWADTSTGFAYTHAVAYNPSEGIMDLGSIFIGKSTRANAASNDGSVVVGWQDFNGPWKSAVWRKNPAGGYFPNQYIWVNPAGNPKDEFNQAGECSTVSADGKWIGGYGDFANNNQPWIWSQDSGMINLGTLPNVGTSFVAGMSADAAIVVGWFNGQLFGDPSTPFIWTRTGGLQELNAYISNVLSYPTGNYQVYTAECISPDGHYIAGYGVNNATFDLFVYRVSLDQSSNSHEVTETSKLNIYPNPSDGFVTLENTQKGTVTIRSMDGKVIFQQELNGTKVLDLSSFTPGVYSVSFQTEHALDTQKIIKK